jgi:hypothetical protein
MEDEINNDEEQGDMFENHNPAPKEDILYGRLKLIPPLAKEKPGSNVECCPDEGPC